MDREGYWWRVRSVQTRQENYIPTSHAAKVYHGWVPPDLQAFPCGQLQGDSLFLCPSSWLFEGVERQKAEELLSLPVNRVGSFMVRESARERGEKGHCAEAKPRKSFIISHQRGCRHHQGAAEASVMRFKVE